MNLKLEYNQDFHQWIEHHIALLKEGKWQEIDVEHLIEELEDMGKSNLRELYSRFVVLIAHLLKWEYQFAQLKNQSDNFTGSSWKGTIVEQRVRVVRLLKDNPSLKRYLVEAIAEAYPDALKIATKETGLSLATFPNACPYSLEQLLDEEFFPEN